MRVPISAFIYRSTPRDRRGAALGAVLLLGATLLLGGCATLTHVTGGSEEESTSMQDRLLGYAHHVDALDDAKLGMALHTAQADYAARPDTWNRFRLAFVLMVPNRSTTDYGTAQILLSNYLRRADGDDDPPLAPLARYLLDSIKASRAAAQSLAKERSGRQALEQKIQKITNVVDHAQRTSEAP